MIAVSREAARHLRQTAFYAGVPLAALLGAVALVWAKVPFPPVAGQPVSASNLDKNFTYLEDLISGKAPCPVDYVHDSTETSFILCQKGVDEIVKVGQGPSSFWIDRYEASVWTGADGSGTSYGHNTNDSFPGVAKNGEWGAAPLYAVSKKGVEPSRNMTWFQAAAFCRASGKRLPTGEEWLAAGMGVASKDPGASDGAGGKCNTQSGGPRDTGGGTACRSRWGAEDMIGNLWELTHEWYAAPGGIPGQAGIGGDWNEQPWPGSYNDDRTWHIASSAYDEQPNGKRIGLPVVGLRGGNWDLGSRTGLFALLLNAAPSYWNSYYGFRCLLPRLPRGGPCYGGPVTRLAGKYRLLRLLGNGAMGVVWAAINESTEREVAIKLIQGSPRNKELGERLLREARASGRIVHRNVVEVHDVGRTEQGQPFLVMQMLRGETLAALFKRVGPLAASVAAAITADILRALTAAHAAGVVHRDLKPENVFLHQESDGFVVLKVVDFGVSKLLDSDEPTSSITGVPIGSPAYMSPEQARGARDVGPHSDLWAVGVLLFELLAGHRPFPGATSYEVVGRVLHGPIPRLASVVPGVDPGIDDLVARCLDRTPTARPSAGEALAALESTLPPGELFSYRALRIPLPPAGSTSVDPLSETVLTGPSGGQTTLTASSSESLSQRSPSPAALPGAEPVAGKTSREETAPTRPADPDKRRPSSLLLGLGLGVVLLGVALRLRASPSAADAGPQPPVAERLPAASAGAQPPATESAPVPPPPAVETVPPTPPAASQAGQAGAGGQGGAARGPGSKAPVKPPPGCPPGCRSLRGTCVDSLELPCKR